jgi:hypothetical protein
MVHLRNKGHNNLRDMKCSDFQILTDSDNNRYVGMNDKLTNNHRRGIADENSQKSRTYEIKEFP